MLKWEALLESITTDDLLTLKEQLEAEMSRRTFGLTTDEKQMRFIPCIKSVMKRLNLSLSESKHFVEAEYEKLHRNRTDWM